MLRVVTPPCPIMSATQDPIGSATFGVQGIMPTTATSRRVSKRKLDDKRNAENARTKSDQASPSLLPSGTGRLVDKAV